MSKTDKLLEKLMSGQSDANFAFEDLALLLQKLGYIMRSTKGSHFIFQKGDRFLNIQNHAGKAKAYQVRQLRDQLKNFKR